MFKLISSIRQKNKDLTNLKSLTNSLPIILCWKDKKLRYRGCNNNFLDLIRLENQEDIIGKTDNQIEWASQYSEIFNNLDRKVLKERDTIVYELKTDTIKDNKKELYIKIYKSPIFNIYGKCKGVATVAIDFTEENDTINKLLSSTDQVVHDIRSPLASINMIVRYSNIPKEIKQSLISSCSNINDITSNMLEKYKDTSSNKLNKDIILSLVISDVINEKKHKIKGLDLDINLELNQENSFITTMGDITCLQRLFSNLINNSIEACNKSKSRIDIYIKELEKRILIEIKDNGSGISQDRIEKINSYKKIKSSKVYGHGIGLTQIQDFLDGIGGSISFESDDGLGTTAKVLLPKTQPPKWLDKYIPVSDNDEVIILDIDKNIYLAWKENIRRESQAKFKYFDSYEDLFKYLNNKDDRSNIILIAEHLPSNSSFNGIKVIKKAKIERSILLTHLYNHKLTRDQISKSNIKVITKSLMEYVSIVNKKDKKHIQEKLECRFRNIVMLEDNENIANGIFELFKNRHIIRYSSKSKLIKDINSFDNNSIFLIDNEINDDKCGLEILEKLHVAGYENLYLFSASYNFHNLPEYVKYIDKLDIYRLIKVVNCGDNEHDSINIINKNRYANIAKEEDDDGIDAKKAIDIIHDINNPRAYTSILLHNLEDEIDDDELKQKIYQIHSSIKYSDILTKFKIDNFKNNFFTLDRYKLHKINIFIEQAVSKCPFLCNDDIKNINIDYTDYNTTVFIDEDYLSFFISYLIKKSSKNISIHIKKEQSDVNIIFKNARADEFILKFVRKLLIDIDGKVEFRNKNTDELTLKLPIAESM